MLACKKERRLVPFGNHFLDLLPILLLALLFFGAKRLPEMGSAVGKTIREFQKSMREVGESSATPAAVANPAPSQQIAAPAPTTRPEPTQPTAEAITGEPIQQ
jgi:sec-independent protein translocase protein TatA